MPPKARETLQRTCIGCGKTDGDPRCIEDRGDGSDITWHPDCHRIAFGDLPCHAVLVKGGEGLTGDALRTFITTGERKDS